MKRKKHIGVESFFVEKKKLLDVYDQAKIQTSDDAVKTEHGFVAEDLVRDWLTSFLPKRFGVCKGYIITHDLEYIGPLEEWDIIIYDSLESPILFTRKSADGPSSGERRAIPVEHVRGIVEVKATLSPTSADEVAKKLLKLHNFIGTNTSTEYPKFLCHPFVCGAVFFETRVKDLKEYRRALDNLTIMLQRAPQLPFMGRLVLRSQKDPSHSGYLQPMEGEQPFKFPEVAEMSSEFNYPNGRFGSFGCLVWAVNAYPMFIFDLLAFIKGKERRGVSSFYGLDFENTLGSRLFS
jgi:hypothetical protein